MDIAPLMRTIGQAAACDYPVEADVKLGVTYGSGVYTGEYDPVGSGSLADIRLETDHLEVIE